ncbi:hypothetical protein EA187_14960 [Lujinxingia sediminis]|uniref:Right handed beta helix domain-containing protein n=1 Tax=Lujinxingia sediminis TaxID=2480984 RepID=A0ABY0CQN8_9DELT|nr:hypothetical protein EA187_14960 [Lujinxingia sediminis]
MSGDEGDITIGEDGLADDLAVGDYTLSAAPFTVALASYEAAPVELTIEADQTTEVTLDFALVRASLEVIIEGLPEGVDAQVEVLGDEGSETLTETTTLTGLAPGSYTITPAQVASGDLLFEAVATTVELASGDAETLTLSYELLPGELRLEVEGLPEGLSAELTLTGPEGFEATAAPNDVLSELVPGTYTLVGSDVSVGPAIYRAQGASVDVVSDQSTTLSVAYEVVPGQLAVGATGLPSNAALRATLVGPAPATTSVNIIGARSFDAITPGDYVLTYAAVEAGGTTYTPNTAILNLTVTSEQSTTATAVYATNVGTLVLNHGLPDSGALTVVVSDGLGFSRNVTLRGTGSTNVELAPGSYEITLASNGLGTDAFGNPYYVLGLDVGFSVASGQSVTTALNAPPPTEVLRGDDQGRGSLREVLNRVVSGSVVTFARGLSQVTTEGLIVLGNEISIVGPGPDQLTLSTTGVDRLFSFGPGADVHLEGIRIADITIRGTGGAIYNLGTFSLRDMVFDRIQVTDDGAVGGAIAIAQATGAIVIEDTVFSNNHASRGGAIDITPIDHRVFLTRVRFEGNSSAIYGGAIDSSASLTIDTASFTNNTSVNGGAIYQGLSRVRSTVIERALFAHNHADDAGGAIYTGVDSTLRNVTFADNNATNDYGGAYYQFDGHTTMSYVTFADNTAPNGSALSSYCDETTSVQLKNAIVVGTGAHFGCETQSAPPYTNPTLSQGYNYIEVEAPDAFDAAPTDQVGTALAPLANPLGLLTDNGGFSPTMAVNTFYLSDLSEPATLCTDVAGQTITEDQRGEDRPTNGLCTAGAFQATDSVSSYEPFHGHGLGASTYVNTTFTTSMGFSWEVSGVRSEGSYGIAGEGLMFRQVGNYVRSVGLTGGVDFISVDYRKAFTGDAPRQISIEVNGTVVATSPYFGDFDGADDSVFTLTADNLNISGDYTIEIHNLTPSSGQVVIDNLSWR